jgi:hypothetical protein
MDTVALGKRMNKEKKKLKVKYRSANHRSEFITYK